MAKPRWRRCSRRIAVRRCPGRRSAPGRLLTRGRRRKDVVMSTTPRIARGRRRLLACGVAALASLFLLSGAQSGVNTPGSGWYAGNPLLGPSNLTHLAAAARTAYAAGNDGTLLKSTDNGVTWNGLVTGVQTNLTIVRIIGDDPASVVIGSPTTILRSDNGGQTFVRLPFSRGGRSSRPSPSRRSRSDTSCSRTAQCSRPQTAAGRSHGRRPFPAVHPATSSRSPIRRRSWSRAGASSSARPTALRHGRRCMPGLLL